MLNRAEIIDILKGMKLENHKCDGPTSFFFTSGDGRPGKINVSVQNELVTVTTGKFIFRRKYRIHKSEL